jgi:hypothetical protein
VVQPAVEKQYRPLSAALTQANLVGWLHDRPADFEATKALQELAATSRRGARNADPAAQAAVVHAGLFGVEQVRRRVTRRTP